MKLKLSPETAREWNKSLGKSKEFASYAQIHEFLTIWTRGPDETKASDAVDAKARGRTLPSVNNVSVPTCVNCAGSHHLAACDDFLSMPIAQRSALAKKKQVYFNCLRSSHYTSKCLSKLRCVHCRRKHHSLLHLEVAYRRPSIKSQRSKIQIELFQPRHPLQSLMFKTRKQK